MGWIKISYFKTCILFQCQEHFDWKIMFSLLRWYIATFRSAQRIMKIHLDDFNFGQQYGTKAYMGLFESPCECRIVPPGSKSHGVTRFSCPHLPWNFQVKNQEADRRIKSVPAARETVKLVFVKAELMMGYEIDVLEKSKVLEPSPGHSVRVCRFIVRSMSE